MTVRVAIITDDPGWHGRCLRDAFLARGVTCLFSSLQHARLEMVRKVRVVLPGFEMGLPDAVFVRGIPGGSLQQVVFYLNILHVMKTLGVRVYNDGRAIERSVDKCLTTARLAQENIPTPPTWVCSERSMAEAVTAREIAQGHSLICKPLFGSQGKGIVKINNQTDLPDANAIDNVWYLQRFIEQPEGLACDWRVFVIAGVAVAAMRRSTKGWLANVAQGGVCHAALPEGQLKQLAERAVASLSMDYAGVDLMRDVDGNWWVIEVNSVPAWRGLQQVISIDIAAALADDLLSKCAGYHRCEVMQ